MLDVSYIMNYPGEQVPTLLKELMRGREESDTLEIMDCFGSMRVKWLEVHCADGLQASFWCMCACIVDPCAQTAAFASVAFCTPLVHLHDVQLQCDSCVCKLLPRLLDRSVELPMLPMCNTLCKVYGVGTCCDRSFVLTTQHYIVAAKRRDQPAR